MDTQDDSLNKLFLDIQEMNNEDFLSVKLFVEKEGRRRDDQIKAEATKAIRDLAIKAGLVVDIKSSGIIETSKNEGKKVKAKYKNPANENEVWSGRGIKPRWFVKNLSNGMTMEEMLI